MKNQNNLPLTPKQGLSIAALLMSVCLVSCAEFVPLKPGAGSVNVLNAYDARACKLIATSRVSVLDKIGPIERDIFKIERELEHLARNAALSAGGDTVSPASPVENGARDFQILRCH